MRDIDHVDTVTWTPPTGIWAEGNRGLYWWQRDQHKKEKAVLLKEFPGVDFKYMIRVCDNRQEFSDYVMSLEVRTILNLMAGIKEKQYLSYKYRSLKRDCKEVIAREAIASNLRARVMSSDDPLETCLGMLTELVCAGHTPSGFPPDYRAELIRRFTQ